MPQVTVYVRQDDLDKWKSISKKSEFIHQALQGAQITQIGSPTANIDKLKQETGMISADELNYEPLND